MAKARKPNILFIMADDIGWFNLSCYNHGVMGYRTPHLDRIAREGAMFTDCYGQQSCTAGRAAFIYQQRNEHFLMGPYDETIRKRCTASLHRLRLRIAPHTYIDRAVLPLNDTKRHPSRQDVSASGRPAVVARYDQNGIASEYFVWDQGTYLLGLRVLSPIEAPQLCLGAAERLANALTWH